MINKGKEFQEEFLTLSRKTNKNQKLGNLSCFYLFIDQNEIVNQEEKYQSSSYNSLEFYHDKQNANKGKEHFSNKVLAIEDTDKANENQHDWFSFQRIYMHDGLGPSLLEKPERLDQEPDEEVKDY